MYQYKFVRLWCVSKKGFWNPSLEHQPEENYHEIIRKHVLEGWRLVQIFAPVNRSFWRGKFRVNVPAYYELIFEREIEGKERNTTPSMDVN